MNKTFYYTYLIYLTNPNSSLYGKIYFGQHRTKNLLDGYIGSGRILNDYLKRYPNDYYRKILHLYKSQEELNQAEFELIYPHLGKEYCINLRDGGDVGRFSEESRKLISISMKDKKRIKENYKDYEGYISKLKDSLTGRTLSEEVKNKISKTLKEHYNSIENRQKLSESVKKIMEAPEIRDKCRIGGYNTQGRIFINKDKTNKRVKPEELNKYITQGWVKGRYKPW